jgi:hypothetical protein
LLGFPDDKKDAALLTTSYRTPSGSWLVKLTPAPLDFSHDDHRAAYVAAAHRFDKVGVRLKPPTQKA